MLPNTRHQVMLTGLSTNATRAVSISLAQHVAHSAGDQRRDIQQRARHRQTVRCRQITRTPHRIEFLLEFAQALKVIKCFAVSLHDASELVPGGSQRVLLEPRERRHPEIEPAKSPPPAP